MCLKTVSMVADQSWCSINYGVLLAPEKLGLSSDHKNTHFKGLIFVSIMHV